MTTVRLNAPLSYPVEAIEDIRVVVDIVRKGQIVERRDEFAKSAWIVQGYVQRLALGDPNDIAERQVFKTESIKAPASVANDTQALDLLETLAENSKNPPKQQRAITIPPEVWQGLLTWLVQRILESLSRRR